MPPRSINKNEAKEINIDYIETMDEDLEGDKKTDNKWYKKFKLFGKKFIQMTRKDVAKKSEYVIYYCLYHFTTIDSNKLTSTGKKAKIPKCKCKNILL